jgi:ribonuclease BN (tRNA processing enzyme)
MEGVLLGSGGWIPTSRRETCSLLLREGPQVLLIDAGTGIQRLLERSDLVVGAESVHIVLTHFHLDHVIGLSYLPALPLQRPPVIWGPGKLLSGLPTASILERLLGPPLFSAPLEAIAREVREVPETEVELDSFAVAVRVQERHSAPTIALRVADAITYCTDTAPDLGNVGFAAGSQVLLHEAWHAQDSSDDPAHTAAGDAARIARKAGVERLVLIHVNPLQESDDQLAAPAQRKFRETEVGVDLAPLPLQ